MGLITQKVMAKKAKKKQSREEVTTAESAAFKTPTTAESASYTGKNPVLAAITTESLVLQTPRTPNQR